VRTLSVGAARLPQVAEWIADADAAECAALTRQALQVVTVDQARPQVKAP
jgi:phosphoenolpyruvate-protein kinase (PTS system EI component)